MSASERRKYPKLRAWIRIKKQHHYRFISMMTPGNRTYLEKHGGWGRVMRVDKSDESVCLQMDRFAWKNMRRGGYTWFGLEELRR